MSIKKNQRLAVLVMLFGRNWVTLFGTALTTSTALTIIGYLGATMLGYSMPPYIGIITLLILPAFFVLGLLLIPFGAYLARRKAQLTGAAPRTAEFSINFARPEVREALGLITLLTAANLFIIAAVSYRGVVYMDSVQFCGKVCHTVMKPEFTAHARSPHSRVECVECHIGPGAPWFVRAKISGVRQVFAVLLNTYDRPIPVPVKNLRPSRDTCEHCHWPEKFTGDRVKVITHYDEDEKNTPERTVLVMHIGGGASSQNGIHSWHIDPRRQTTYVTTDPTRQRIDLVRVKEDNGSVVEYRLNGKALTPAQLAKAQTRVMDCIDCHNRPTHTFQLPGQAMDQAMVAGKIDTSLPYIKKIGVQALTAAKGAPGDLKQIAKTVRDFYQQKYSALAVAKSAKINAAIHELQTLYSQNVFPAMKVTWGTYPNNIGHMNFPGCFRCHDGNHISKDGKTIKQDCTMCHAILDDPAVLKDLGISQ